MNETIPLLPLSSTSSPIPRTACLGRWKNRLITLICGSSATIAAGFFAQTVTDIATHCFNAEMISQEAFNVCMEPSIVRFAICASALTVSAIALGSRISCKKLQPAIHTITTKYRSESIIGLICLYNGLFIPVSDTTTFLSALAVSAAGLTIGAVSIGVYLRKLYASFKQDVETTPFSPHKIALLAFSGTLCIIPVTEVGILLFSHIIGEGLARLAHYRHKIALINLFPTSLLAIGGSLTYLCIPSPAGRLISMGLIGVAQGIDDAKAKEGLLPLLPCNREPLSVVKQVLPPILLAGFGISSQILNFFDCQGVPGPMNYTCPIGWELSLYTSPNQVVLSSTGVNVALGSACIVYYGRRAIRWIATYREGKWQTAAITALEILNRLNFTCVTLLPYVTVLSGGGWEANFYTYNPLPALILAGIAIGNYKETINIQGERNVTAPHLPL